MTEKVIQVHNPHNLPTLPYTAFEEFQGDLALPMTSQAIKKLRGSLIKHGVFLPTYLWFDDQQRANILDGHQRKTVFGSLAADGWEIPEIPYVSVDASNRKDAAEKLLQIRSRYAQVNPETTWLSEFVEGTNDLIQMLDKVEIPDLDLDSLLTSLDLNDRPDESTLDDLPPEPEHIVIKPGDLIELGGKHRILCGDSTKREDVDLLCQDVKVNGIFTSPPYAEQRKEQYGGVVVDQYVQWWEDIQANMRNVLAEDGSLFVNIKPHCEHGQRVLYVFDLVLAMVREWQWRFVDELCWEKNGFPGGYNNRFKNNFEPVFQFCINEKIKFYPWSMADNRIPTVHIYGKSGSGSGFDSGTFTDNGKGVLPSNVLHIQTGEVNLGTQGHPATFPVKLPEFFIKAYSDEGDLWFDPFLGSGTTMIAAEHLDRRCFGMERSEVYTQLCVDRWCQVTGRDDISINGQPVSWADYSPHV